MSSVQGKLAWLYRAVLLTHKISTCDLALDYPQDLRLQLSHPPLLSITAFTACYLHSQDTGLYSGPGWEEPGPASGLFTCSPRLAPPTFLYFPNLCRSGFSVHQYSQSFLQVSQAFSTLTTLWKSYLQVYCWFHLLRELWNLSAGNTPFKHHHPSTQTLY